jgi:hypothetical protein
VSYISELEHELLRAGRARQRRRLPPVPHVSLGGTAVAVAGLASLVLAVLAIALLGHRAPVHQDGGSTAVPLGAQRLVSALAILRRPQTAADRSLAAGALPLPGGPLIPSLTRLAVNQPAVKVFIVVNAPGRQSVWPARLGDQVSVIAQVDHRSYRTFPVPYVALRDTTTARNGGGYIVELVPDGVAKVRWSFPVKTGSYPLFGRVVNNVALNHFGPAQPQPGLATDWWAANGRQVPTTTNVVMHQLTNQLGARIAARHAHLASNPPTIRYTVSPRLVQDFPLLSRGATKRPDFTVTRLSAAAAAPIVGAMAQPGEPAQIDLRSVLAVNTHTGLHFWVAPGANGICIVARHTGACPDDLASVLSAGMWDIIRGPNGAAMFVGVVPKTNTSVTFGLKSGGTRTVPVIDGLVITPDAGIIVTHMRGADGRMTP